MAWYNVFVPDKCLKTYRDLTVKQLKTWGCRCLLLDLDNTLVPYDVRLADQQVRDFVAEIQAADIEIILTSNNSRQRVQPFAEDLGLKFYASMLKPLAGVYQKILKDINVQDKSEVLCLGDQLLTDVWGAHNAGLRVVWVRPLVERDLWSTRINRFFEHRIYRLLVSKGLIDEEM